MSFVGLTNVSGALAKHLRADIREKFPKACSAALSRTAVQCKNEMKEHMRKSFDRPTPYAINSVQAVTATVETMSSAVLLRQFAAKGTPAEKYLAPEILGGVRAQKRFERALISIQALQGNGFAMPGSSASMDAYGNERASEIVKILSVLRAFGEQGYHANRAKSWSKKTRDGQIFVIRQGNTRGGLKPGVYKRTSTGVLPLMIFATKAPAYRVRLSFDELVAEDAKRVFPAELRKAIEELRR